MTVISCGEDMLGEKFVAVSWFDGAKPMHGSYVPEALEKKQLRQTPILLGGLLDRSSQRPLAVPTRIASAIFAPVRSTTALSGSSCRWA